MLEWDFVAGVLYRVNAQDAASFTEEMTARYDDFHRAAMRRRYLAASAGMVRPQQYMTQLSDDAGFSSGAVMTAYMYRAYWSRLRWTRATDIGPVDAPRQLVSTLKGNVVTGSRVHEVRRAKCCVSAASTSRDDDHLPVFNTCSVNFVAVRSASD